MSAYTIAINGMKTQSDAAYRHAAGIIQSTTVPHSEQASAAIPVDRVSISGTADGTTLEEHAVGLVTAKHAYTASAKIISVQSEMDDALLNIIS